MRAYLVKVGIKKKRKTRNQYKTLFFLINVHEEGKDEVNIVLQYNQYWKCCIIRNMSEVVCPRIKP